MAAPNLQRSVFNTRRVSRRRHVSATVTTQLRDYSMSLHSMFRLARRIEVENIFLVREG